MRSLPSGQRAATLVLERAESALTVQWPSATDETGVVGYSVYLDGRLVERTSSERLNHSMTGLVAGSTYELTVIATDERQNRSAPLMAEYTLLDQEPPNWPASAQVRIINLTSNEATIAWTPAVDNVGLSSYEIRASEDILARVEGEAQARLLNLSPRTLYTFEIYAFDDAGLATLSPLSIELETLGEVARLAEESVLTVTQSSATALTLRWDDAASDQGEVRYRVEEDGAVIAEVQALTFQRGDLQTPSTHSYSGQSTKRGT